MRDPDILDEASIKEVKGNHLPKQNSESSVRNVNTTQDYMGHSEESSENVVADHRTFDQIQREHIAAVIQIQNQSQSLSDAEEIASPQRRIKKVLFSDKSESSVNEMMDDTPSNYNIQNCRFGGQSMGLKGMVLYNQMKHKNHDSTEEDSNYKRQNKT